MVTIYAKRRKSSRLSAPTKQPDRAHSVVQALDIHMNVIHYDIIIVTAKVNMYNLKKVCKASMLQSTLDTKRH